ncbi:MAG: CapA family protein [Polyangiaceae bacterium]
MTSKAPGRASMLIVAALSLSCNEHEKTASQASSARPETRPIDLWVAGDVHGIGPDTEQRLAPLASRLSGALGFVNLEGAVDVAGHPPATILPDGRVVLANPASGLGALASAGVRFVDLANNHAADLGDEGASARLAREAGLEPLGRSAPLQSVGEGASTLHLAALELTPDLDVKRELARLLGPEDLQNGHLIVAFHVNGPPSYLPSALLRSAADEAIRLGADVVLSHGTHALGPIERRGDAVIAWGLGNLLFSCSCTRERDGLVLRLSFPAERAIQVEVIPVDAGLDGAPATLSHDSGLIFDLLDAIGSSPLSRGRDGTATLL